MNINLDQDKDYINNFNLLGVICHVKHVKTPQKLLEISLIYQVPKENVKKTFVSQHK